MKQNLLVFAGGVIGGIIGVALTAMIPWLAMTWEMAAVMVPFNSAIVTLHLARKRRHAERMKLAPARMLRGDT